MRDASMTPTIVVAMVPVSSEDEDLETVALANALQDEARTLLAAQPGYVLTAPEGGPRDGVIQIVGDMVQQVWTHQAEFAALFGAIMTTLTALSKHRRISEIEINRGTAKLVLKDVDRATAERMLRDFAAQAVNEPGPARITSRVSKHKK